MSLPNTLLYMPKPVAVRSRSYRSNVPTSNKSSFNAGDTLRFDIPTGTYATYLNNAQSYLKFKITNTDADGAAVIQKHVSSMFKSLTIYHAGNLLESIEDYGSLYCTFLDGQVNAVDSQTVLSFQGCDTHASNNIVLTGESIASTADLAVTMPLALSGILGAQLNKYLPIGAMGGADLRVELELQPLAKIVDAGHAGLAQGDVTISEAEFVSQIVQIDPAAQAEIDRQAQGIYQLSTESYRHYSTTKATESSLSFNIPAKFSSLKGIILVHRSTNAAVTGIQGNNQARCTGGLTQYNFKVGSLLVPQKPVKVLGTTTAGKDGAEAYMEFQKVFASVSNIDAHSRIDRTNYNINAADVATGTFVIGQELESFSNRTEVLEQGINTLGSGIYFEGTYSGAYACNVDAWANFDMMLVIEGGVASARF